MPKKTQKNLLNISEAFESDLKKLFIISALGVPIFLRGNKFGKAFRTLGINTRLSKKMSEKLFEDFSCSLNTDKDTDLKPAGSFDLKLGNKSLMLVAENAKKLFITEFDDKKIKSYELKNSDLAKVALALQFFGLCPNLKLSLSAANKYYTGTDLDSYISAYAKSSHSSLESLQAIAKKKQQLSRQMKATSLRQLKRVAKVLKKDIRSTMLQTGLSLIFEYKSVRKNTPISQEASVLINDLIIDEYQIYHARKDKAEVICLQASLLSTEQLSSFLKTIQDLKMLGLVYVKNRDELKAAIKINTEAIAISDLKLLKSIPKNKIIVYTGKVDTKKSLQRIPRRIDAILSPCSRKLLKLMARPKTLPKSCAVRSIREVRLSREMGVDCIGLNFIPDSEDRISYQMAAKLIAEIRKDKKSSAKIFGVFQGQELSEVNNARKTLGLDFVQLSGEDNLIYPER